MRQLRLALLQNIAGMTGVRIGMTSAIRGGAGRL